MTRRQRCRGESGATLVELLLTMVILGTGVVAIVGGMGASAVASDYHRKQTTTQALLKNAAEFLKSNHAQNAPFRTTCPVDYSSRLAVFWGDFSTRRPAEAAGYQVSLVKHEYWNGSTSPAGFSSTCVDNGLQRLTLEARSLDGRITEKLHVVKRRPDA